MYWKGWMEFSVIPTETATVQEAQDQVVAALRAKRGLKPNEDNTFDVVGQDKLLDSFNSITRVFFLVMLALFSAWSAAVLAWVHLRPAGPRLALVATGVDVVAISMLAVLSGGAFSHARLAFFLVPVAVAFRFRPLVTSVARSRAWCCSRSC